MKFSLIICTYFRPDSLLRLLKSVEMQTLYPDEVIVVDGSDNDATELMLSKNSFENLKYYKVDKNRRGLTKQRNLGIEKSGNNIGICCFLDDDIVLKPIYFENLISVFSKYPDAVGVGGAIINEGVWKEVKQGSTPEFQNYYYKGWERKLGSRNVLRKRLSLLSEQLPGIMPEFSNGFSIGFYPPNGEIHQVEYFMGGVSAYKKELFAKIKFSEYFKGYGLYEDMDFCLRASKIGNLYLNTAAQCYHLHEESGRPDYYKYGKMVVRNGWYVWRVKYPNPGLQARLKWHTTSFLLTLVRLSNTLNTSNKKAAFKEALGRVSGWWSLIFNKPTINR